MAMKKTIVEKKKRTMYFENDLYVKFSRICEQHEMSPSKMLNSFMKRIVKDFSWTNDTKRIADDSDGK